LVNLQPIKRIAMIKAIYKIIILVLSVISVSFAVADTSYKIDTTKILAVDITGDGEGDSIFCRITGESWEKPFTTHYRIVSKSKTILSETASDEALDQEFGNPSMIEGCDGYLPCKKEWYLEKLAGEVLMIYDLKNKRRKDLLDSTSDRSINNIARQIYIDSLGFSRKKAKAESKKLSAFLRKKKIVLINIPALPVYRSIPRIYDPLQKRFIGLFGL
jgi:hypothetical protein